MLGWPRSAQITCACGAALWLLAAGARPELARVRATFPPALDAATVQDWLRRETGASASQIVAISPSAATRVLAVEETGPDRRRLLVEAQALSAEAAARSGVLAWRTSLEADCASGRIRLGPTTGYASRRVVGAGVPLGAADPDWRIPMTGTQLDSLRQAACGPPAAPRAAPKPPLIAETSGPNAVEEPGPAPHSANLAVQVISSPNPAETAQALRRLQARPGGAVKGLQPRITSAQVRGQTTYRGLMTGFASRDAAAAFCRDLLAARQSCFLRQPPPEGRPLKLVATR
jgi:hypothetical protein